MKTILSFLALVIIIGTAQAQEMGMIKGKIINKATKQGVIRATISVQDSKQKARSDTAGFFSIKDVPDGNYSLRITYIGYKEKIVNDVHVLPGKSAYIEIELEESPLTSGEVVVSADKYDYSPITPVSTYSFSRDEISRNPSSQGDIFRAIGMLPGVSSSGGEYSAIAVRGQGTRDNVYIVDDIPITQVSHLEGNVGSGFNDPNGGRFSIFAPRVINDAEFQGGGLAAQYGRRSASYLGLTIKEGNREDFVVDGQLDLLGATINYDGPSYLLDNTSLFVSARYQNFGPVLNLINRKDAGLPTYGDLIIKSSSQLSPNTKLSVIAIHSPETYTHNLTSVRADTALNQTFLYDQNNVKDLYGLNLLSLTSNYSYWKNVLYFTRTALTTKFGLTYPSTDQNGKLIDPNNIPINNPVSGSDYSESEFGFRSIYSIDFQNKTTLTAGVDADRVALVSNRHLNQTDTIYVFNQSDPRPSPTTYYVLSDPKYYNRSYDNYAFNGSAYVDYSFQLGKIVNLNTGLRYDYNGFSTQSTVSPRLSGSFQLDDANSINFAAGLYYQDPVYSEVADQPDSAKLKEEQIQQYVIGYRTYFTPDLKLSVEGWYKKFDKLVVRPLSYESYQTNDGTGWAGGFDINLTKRLSDGLHGMVGFSYMQSKRDDHNGLGEYNFAFSQPYQFNMLLSYKPDDHWIFAGKFKYATGKPTDRYIIHSNIFNDPNYVRYSEEIIGQNQDRLADFISLDLRVDYSFRVKGINLTAFLDVLNALNRQNQFIAFLNNINGKIYYDGLAIFPTAGLKFEF
jgi:hypothetical protein